MSATLRLLIVDDNRAEVERMQQELGRCGFDVHRQRVETASELRAALVGGSWDLVVSERVLPGFGAHQALAVVKEINPEIPLIVLSANLTEETAAELMRAGAKDCLRKESPSRWGPVVARELREAENRRARARAEQEAFRLAAVVHSSSEGIIAQTPDGIVTAWNPTAEKLFGWSASEAIGRRISFLVPPDRLEEHSKSMERLRRGERVEHGETIRVRKDGTRVDVAITASPVLDQAGRVIGTAKFARDITEKKLLEQEYRHMQKMNAIGELAGGVAHDFNNLLTIIFGYTDLLLQRFPPNDPSRGPVEEIYRAGERSAALTRQLLAFSRKQVIVPMVLDLNALVCDTEKMLRRVIGEDIRLETFLQPHLGHVKAGAGQLEQVLVNLTLNARDAMPTGGRLTLRTENANLWESSAHARVGVLPGSYVVLAVSDTGCGMTEEVKARIFEPFFTTKEPGKGTGLGLAVVHGIVKEAGGGIEVYSEPGVGTTFKVYLPRADPPVWSGKPSSVQLAPPCGKETILLAEDEDGVRALTHHILAGCGYNVLDAASGDEAVGVVRRHPQAIDLLVTDVVLPGLGGGKLAEQILAVHPRAKVLYLSGYTNDAVIRHGILHDEVQFLQKPFSPLSLACKVREVLDSG
jgi:PAS domain S-box-containing protein